MSTADTKTTIEETFASRLGIEMTSPRVFAELIMCFAGTREVIAAVGPSGVGKTAIPKQVAASRNGGKGVPYVGLHVPTMTMEDCHIPTTAPDTKAYFDRRIPRRFEPLLTWVEKHKDKNGKVPLDLVPILSIEELNRAVDKSVTRALFTLLDDRMIGDVQLDDNIQIVVTMNPTGGGMAVNEFERDPAMRRRLRPIGVPYSYGDFMTFANAAKFHEHVLGHLGSQPNWGYDEQASLAGKAYACPATWESVSRVCFQFEALGRKLDTLAGRAIIAGAVGSAAASAFLDYVRDNTAVVTPEDVMTTYAENSESRRRFKSFLTEDGGRLDKVTELTQGLATKILSDNNRKPETYVSQVAAFMADLPVEILMSFIQRITDESTRMGQESKNYLTNFNRAIGQLPGFLQAMRNLHDAKAAADKEVAKKK